MKCNYFWFLEIKVSEIEVVWHVRLVRTYIIHNIILEVISLWYDKKKKNIIAHDIQWNIFPFC